MVAKMKSPSPNLWTIEAWWEQFNEDEFGGKMTAPSFGLTRSRHTDGYYEHFDSRPNHKLVISTRCFDDEDLLCGTILHEMIHQYQHTVLHRPCNHDAIFCSIARRLERKYNIRVR